MRLLHDAAFLRLAAGTLGFLFLATVVARVLQLRSPSGTIANLNSRINAWWVMSAVFAVALLTGGVGSYVLFALMSFLALREFVTLAHTERGDHRALFWAFFIVTPLQYLLVSSKAYGLFSIMIPVYAFPLIAFRIVLAGQTSGFLTRTAEIQWGLIVCVYGLSYAPPCSGSISLTSRARERSCCSFWSWSTSSATSSSTSSESCLAGTTSHPR